MNKVLKKMDMLDYTAGLLLGLMLFLGGSAAVSQTPSSSPGIVLPTSVDVGSP